MKKLNLSIPSNSQKPTKNPLHTNFTKTKNFSKPTNTKTSTTMSAPMSRQSSSSSLHYLLKEKSAHLAILASVLGCAGTEALEEVLSTPTFQYQEFKSRSKPNEREHVSEDEDGDVFAVRIDEGRRRMR
jgi:hypothetical protein